MLFNTKQLEMQTSNQTKDLFSHMVMKSEQDLLKFFCDCKDYKNFLIKFLNLISIGLKF